MKAIYITAILACLFFSDAFAITWGKMIEFGTGVYVHSIRRTSDGGVILEISQNNVAKLSSNGNLEWQKSGIFQAVEASDGGIAAIGANNGSWFLTKFNKKGTMIWQKTFDFETTGSVVFMRLRAVGSKGYILAGSEFNRAAPRKCLLLRTDSQGNPLWLKKYPGFNLRDMETSSEGFVLVGRPNVTVLRVSESGELQFKGSYGFGSEEPAGIQPTIDGNIVVVSNRRANPIQSYVTKFSNNGKMLLRESISGEPKINLTSIRSTREGYLVAGTRRAPNEPNQNMFILQLDDNGIIQFADYFGGTASEFGFAIATTDNHFAIAGSTIAPDSGNQAGFVMKFPRNENGGSFCTFFKDYKQPFKTLFVTPPPPIVLKNQIVENPKVTGLDTTTSISEANLEFTDLCD